ncbi:uncharacterized protein cd8b [Nothobranchius furzeri]|uniref:LOC107385463-like protein n=1 Tax=Nothobranchius furzeri TaxID=105023 RepID=A0A9D2XV48_NOTFU|nr:putative LOC107385463-like protein [Nothobranchius furzeri]
MIRLQQAWILLMVSSWTLGSSQMLQQDPVKVLYPEILSNETIECKCRDISCNVVFWFRTVPSKDQVEFIGKCNNADRTSWGAVDHSRFKLSKRGMSTFLLRIHNVTEEDAGIYSCIPRDERGSVEVFHPGVLLQPGVTPPTSPPPKVQHKPRHCPCSSKNQPMSGCHSLVLWPLVGLISSLSLGLVCTLHYFSRLPKKCHHHFMKKRPM